MALHSVIGRALALTTLSLVGGLLAPQVKADAPGKASAAKTSAAKASATLTLVPKGGTSKVGGYYMPQRLQLSAAKPAHLKKEPKYTGTPKYGVLHFGDAHDNSVIVVLDEATSGGESKLYVDSNHDGDLTNDPAITWKKQGTAANTLFMGDAEVQPRLAHGATKSAYGLTLYHFSPETAQARHLPADLLLFYRDYAATGEITLADKKYRIAVLDESAAGRFDVPHTVGPRVIAEIERPVAPFTLNQKTPVLPNLFEYTVNTPTLDWSRLATAPAAPAAPVRMLSLLIDRDGSGTFEAKYERFDAGKPFTIEGKTYEVDKIAADGSRIDLKPSHQQVAEIPIPPSLRAGKPSLAFNKPGLDGKTISFPNDYKGKVVMLDFWATWCGPCRAELPGLVKAYEKYHEKGFEVLGISLDQENMKDKVAEFLKTNNMSWAQIYDGKYWKAEVAQMYGIDSIPHAFLVDGDTGKIISEGNGLRGTALDGTISSALAAKVNATNR